MNRIAISILVLGTTLATSVIANETAHNGQRVTIASALPAAKAGNAATAGSLSFTRFADASVVNDPARGSRSGK